MSLDKKAIDDVVSALIAPVIAIDGGQMVVVGVDEEASQIQVRFGGTYNGSPCRGVVLKYLVEPLLKSKLSELKSVLLAD